MACDPNRLAYWTEHYSRWRSSGISQRAYCEHAGLSFFTFDHWRRQAREAVGVVAEPTASTEKLTLVPVRLDANDPADGIQLRSPGGWCVTLPTTLGTETLLRLLSQLP